MPPCELSCPAQTSLLYSAAKFNGAAAVHDSTVSGLLTWNPRPGRFLVLYCDYGQLSNRLLCIRNHIILAGLLNRTLVAEPVNQQLYTLPLHVDLSHLRTCFGEASAQWTSEYTQQRGGASVVIDEWVCLASLPKIDRRTMRVRNVLCTDKFCRLQIAESGSTALSQPLSFKKPCLKSMQEIVAYLSSVKLRDVPVLVLGDLTMLGFLMPAEYTIPGDVPFVRRKGCSNALALVPSSELMAHAAVFVRSEFEGAPYVAVHMRRGDRSKGRCSKEWSASCLPVDHVASCVARDLQETGIRALLICTDASAEELQVLTGILQESGLVGLRVVVNPQVQDDRPDLIGIGGEGHAAFQKVAMAQGTVFVGTDMSTFTADVQRMRRGLLTGHCRDHFICEGASHRVKVLDPFVATLL